MPLFVKVRSLLRNLFSSRRAEVDLDREVHSHLEMLTEENIRAGMPPKEAQRAARIELGGIEQVKEQVREEHIGNWFRSAFFDCRYGLRQLRKTPGFTTVVILTLALGIGANTAIFSMVNALLLHPYRFSNLDSLVLIWENRGMDEGFDARWISPGDATDLRTNKQLFEDIATFQCHDFNLSSEGKIDVARGCRVSANFFDILGIGPAQGRLFSAEEEQPGSDQAATAIHLRHINLNKVLKETGRNLAAPTQGRLRNGLVSVQVTFALVLLVSAGLTMQGFNRLAHVYQGFQPDQVLKFEVALPESGYPDSSKRGSFFQTALRGVSSLPGASGAALASNLPASNVDNEKTLFTIQGRPALQASEAPAADLQIVSGDYFSALKIPLIGGRFFTEADNASAAQVVVISQAMANRFWPAADALGQRFKLGAANSGEPWMTVVGVVGDARQNWWNPATFPVIYQSYLQSSRPAFRFVLRVASNPIGYASAVRGIISRIDPEIAITELKTLQSEVQDSIAIVHIMGILLAIFGAVALLLSSLGVYGILSENVAQRTHEFGIRFALGAHPRDVLHLVLRHALTVSGIGLLIGWPISLAVSRVMAAFVFGIVSVSFPVLASLAGLLILVALTAAYFPARRALRVDPIIALRYE